MALMNVRKSAFIDLFEAFVECWAYSRITDHGSMGKTFPYNGLFAFCLSQGFAWLATIGMSVLVEGCVKGLVQNEFFANEAKEAGERLLSGLCDTMVRLDHGLCIVSA